METKTAKITNVSPNGSWNGQNGLLYKFNVAFDNGDTGGVMTKDEAQARYVKGETITYTIEEKNGFKNIKRVEEKKPFGGGGGRVFNPAADEKRNVTIVLQSCLDRSIQFHAANGYSKSATDLGGKLKEAWNTAEWFAKKVLHSQLLPQTPAEPAKPAETSHQAARNEKPFEEAKPQPKVEEFSDLPF